MRITVSFSALALIAFADVAVADGSSSLPRIPVADFATLPFLQKPILSPDGHRFVARHVADGKTTIVLFNADHPEEAVRSIPAANLNIFALSWAGNHRLLLTAMLKGDLLGTTIPYLRLIAIDVDSGQSRVVDGKSRGVYAGDVIYADPTGDWALVSSQDSYVDYPSVKRVDLATGAATVVEKSKDGVWDWYADDHGVVRAGVAYSGRRWTVWYRDKPGEKLRVLKGKFEKDDDGAVDKFIFRGEQSWILTNERTGRFALYKYDTSNGAVGDAIFEHPEVDVDDAIYDRASGKILAVEYEDERPRLKWLSTELDVLQSNIDKALPASVNLPTDWSDDHQRVLVWSYSGADPGRYYLLDRSSRKMSPVLDPYPQIDPASLAEMKPIEYHARDGLKLHAYLTLPRGRDPKHLPLILMPHGGPFARDHWQYDPLVQFLANRGYAVFQPEFRGSTGYGKDFVAKGYGEWGRKMQDDLDDGVDALVASGQVDAKRVCVVGSSYGGYAAMWGAVRSPSRYRCAASMAGVSDLPALLKHDKQLFSATRYYKEWRTKVGGEGKADLRGVSPLSFAGEIKVPLLLGHGEQDENVPPQQTHAMVDALNKAGAPVTSVFYKDSGHGFDSSADLEDWLKRLESFLAKYNPA